MANTDRHEMKRRRRDPAADEEERSVIALIVNGWLVGAFVGVALAAALIAMNVGGLYDLIAGAGDPVTPVLLFAAGCATMVGALWSAISVMLLPKLD